MISVSITVNVPLQQVWELWTNPEHIKVWNNVNDDWHNPRVQVVFKTGGHFLYRMETKDGATGFDYAGTFDLVIPGQRVEITLHDGRKAINIFHNLGHATRIDETFDPAPHDPPEFQERFCTMILHSFKQYAESHSSPETRSS